MNFKLEKSDNEYYHKFTLDNLAYNFETKIDIVLEEWYCKNLQVLLIDSSGTPIINADFYEHCSKTSGNNNYIEILAPNRTVNYHNNPLIFKIIDNNDASSNLSIEVNVTSIQI